VDKSCRTYRASCSRGDGDDNNDDASSWSCLRLERTDGDVIVAGAGVGGVGGTRAIVPDIESAEAIWLFVSILTAASAGFKALGRREGDVP